MSRKTNIREFSIPGMCTKWNKSLQHVLPNHSGLAIIQNKKMLLWFQIWTGKILTGIPELFSKVEDQCTHMFHWLILISNFPIIISFLHHFGGFPPPSCNFGVTLLSTCLYKHSQLDNSSSVCIENNSSLSYPDQTCLLQLLREPTTQNQLCLYRTVCAHIILHAFSVLPVPDLYGSPSNI